MDHSSAVVSQHPFVQVLYQQDTDSIAQFHQKRHEAHQAVISVLERYELFSIQLEVEHLWNKLDMSPVHFLRQCSLLLLRNKHSVSLLKKEMKLDERMMELEQIYSRIDNPILQGQIMMGIEESKFLHEQLEEEERYQTRLEEYKCEQEQEDKRWNERLYQRRKRACCDLVRRKVSVLLGFVVMIGILVSVFYLVGFGKMISPFLIIANAGDEGTNAGIKMAKEANEACTESSFSWQCIKNMGKTVLLGIPTSAVSGIASWSGWTPLVILFLCIGYMMVNVISAPITELFIKGWSLEFDAEEPVRTIVAKPQRISVVKSTSTAFQLLEMEQKRKQTIIDTTLRLQSK